MSERIWTHHQFDEMSWHDNHVHGLHIIEGSYGSGQLILDLDYILEWVKNENGGFLFRILLAVLKFFDVTSLRVSLDYATPSAALGPFSVHAITRRIERRERYEAQIWNILINWPAGEISFEASGFEQKGVGTSQLSNSQYLNMEGRGHGA